MLKVSVDGKIVKNGDQLDSDQESLYSPRHNLSSSESTSSKPNPPEPVSSEPASPEPVSSDSASPEPASSGLKKNSSLSRKRKGLSLRAPRSRLKQLKPYLNEDYRLLFNDTVGVFNGETLENLTNVTSSQIGVTLWSSEEKAIFFDSLAKKGRNDLPGIAIAIGTKTELEVHVYLQLLHKYLVKQHLEGRSRQLFDISKIPGALEISQNCSAELELAADALSARQEREDQKLEIRRHKELWLLNANVARWVEHYCRDGGKTENEVRMRMPAAELLNLRNFLRLSESIFMNSSVVENNWRHYRTKPSIMYTAFSDFHTLAISISKRLIQSTIFFALSRHRAASAQRHKPQKTIRRQDVVAALNVLGMNHNAREYWVGAARRCRLIVYDSAKGGAFTDQPLTYENIERALSRGDREEKHSDVATRKDNDPATISRATRPPGSSAKDYSNQDPSDYESSNSIFSTTSNSKQLSSLRNNRPSSGQETQEDDDKDDQGDEEEEDEDDADEDAYAEALDKKASQYEEQRLWRLLGKEPPDSIKPKELKLPKSPPRKRKVGEELDDWRSWVDYVPEWETYETPLSRKEFMKNRKTWRKSKTASSATRKEIPVEHFHQYSESSDEISVDEDQIPNSSDDQIEHDTESLESSSNPSSSPDVQNEDSHGRSRFGFAREPEDVSEDIDEEKHESVTYSDDSMEESESESENV